MINHSTESPLWRHKDMSPGANRRLSASAPMIYSESERAAFSPTVKPLNQKTVWRCQADKGAQDKVCRTCEKLQRGHVSPVTTTLTPASFTRNNGHPVSDALHKSNRLPVCLPAGGGERSETAVSVPASCSLSLSVSPQPRLISAFQLFFFFNSAPSLSSS